jgi:phage terminase large subunit
MKTTRIFKETLQAWVDGKRRCLHEGGTSSSKTFSVLQALVIIASEAVSPLLISIVSESLPHLKRGAMRDFFNILDESPDNNPYFNKSEGVYRRPGWKGVIEFFGADDDGKVRGPRRDILFMNEGNNIPWETARGLDIRTSRFTIVDWNPTGEFWAHENWLNDNNSSYVHSTYLDARDVLPKQTVLDIESYKDKDPNWWHVYGLGLVGKVEGLVYPYFEQVDQLPAGNIFYGLDFGYSDDPAVLVANVIVGDKLYSREVMHKTGMTNDVIARNMDLLGIRQNYDEIYADCSEPKSIEEIHRKGFNIKPCEKGQGSVEYGIQKVNQYKQFWTKDSINCIKEQRNFRYIADKDGKLTEKTTHKWSHGMDARRYAVSSQITTTQKPKVKKAGYAF